MSEQTFSILILAAGKATRFKSEHSKLLHRLAGRPLGEYVLRAAEASQPERLYMVIGHEAEAVRKTFARPGVIFIEQKEPRGTGHALLVSRSELEKCPSPALVILVGDVPLLRPETLRGLVAAHVKARAAATVLTTRRPDSTGYGRILRSGRRIRAIVEEKVATSAHKKIKEINSGILCFSLPLVLAHLGELSDQNAQKEYLLTDLVEILNRRRQKVIAYPVVDSREVSGINDRLELAQIERLLRLRKAEQLARDGVTILVPEATYIDDEVEVGRDTVLEPGVSLLGRTRVGSGATLQAYVTVSNSVLGDRVTVRPYTLVSGSEIAQDVTLGPFAHLRDGAVIEREVRIGNFVEVKKSRIGPKTKALHLAYLGDAQVGQNVNVGAVTVTCNYDGEKKHPTAIEDGCFIGSGTMLVAPVRVGKGSYVAAGSTITENVPPESLAIARSRQSLKEGWARERDKTPSAQAVSVRDAEGVAIVGVRGRLTMGEVVRDFTEAVRQRLEAGQTRLVIDLGDVAYIDSSGIGGLVGAASRAKSAGGRLKLCSVSQKLLHLLEAANVARVFEIHPHEAAALASFKASSA